MNTTKKIMVGAVLSVAAASSASAINVSRFYGFVGMNWGKAVFHRDISNTGAPTKANLDNLGRGLYLGAGYHVSQELSVELYWRRLHDVINNTTGKALMEHDNSEVAMFKFTAPSGIGGFKPYVGAGAAYTRYTAGEDWSFEGREIKAGKHKGWSPVIQGGATMDLGATKLNVGYYYTIHQDDVPKGSGVDLSLTFMG